MKGTSLYKKYHVQIWSVDTPHGIFYFPEEETAEYCVRKSFNGATIRVSEYHLVRILLEYQPRQTPLETVNQFSKDGAAIPLLVFALHDKDYTYEKILVNTQWTAKSGSKGADGPKTFPDISSASFLFDSKEEISSLSETNHIADSGLCGKEGLYIYNLICESDSTTRPEFEQILNIRSTETVEETQLARTAMPYSAHRVKKYRCMTIMGVFFTMYEYSVGYEGGYLFELDSNPETIAVSLPPALKVPKWLRDDCEDYIQRE